MTSAFPLRLITLIVASNSVVYSLEDNARDRGDISPTAAIWMNSDRSHMDYFRIPLNEMRPVSDYDEMPMSSAINAAKIFAAAFLSLDVGDLEFSSIQFMSYAYGARSGEESTIPIVKFLNLRQSSSRPSYISVVIRYTDGIISIPVERIERVIRE